MFERFLKVVSGWRTGNACEQDSDGFQNVRRRTAPAIPLVGIRDRMGFGGAAGDTTPSATTNVTRRDVLASSALAIAGGALAVPQRALASGSGIAGTPSPRNLPGRESKLRRALEGHPLPPGLPGRDYLPVEAPNSGKIPFQIVDGVKVFHLVAMEVWNEFVPGLKALCRGYNGMVHPVLEAMEGERVRMYVTNRLPEATTVHWHGLYVPNGMDGVGGLTQAPIPPGETFKYEFNLVEHGTKMFHAHYDEMTPIALGLTGLFVIHPRRPQRRVDRDFAIMLHEWRIAPGAYRPDPLAMTDFNVFTMNAKSFPATHPLVARTGQRVRIRLGNLGPMDHHPIHLHNYSFNIVATDGGDIPESAQQRETTVLVPVGTTQTIEFSATNPGDWAMHRPMTHHPMTQMGRHCGNMIGMKPGDLGRPVRRLPPDCMTMGPNDMPGMRRMPGEPNSQPMAGGKGPYGVIDRSGMFTILKVRDGIKTYEDPGWYSPPPDTRADVAPHRDLRRDGVNPHVVPAVIAGPSSPAAAEA